MTAVHGLWPYLASGIPARLLYWLVRSPEKPSTLSASNHTVINQERRVHSASSIYSASLPRCRPDPETHGQNLALGGLMVAPNIIHPELPGLVKVKVPATWIPVR